MKLKFFFTICLILCTNQVSAQWKGGAWSYVLAYGVCSSNLFQSTSDDSRIPNVVLRYGPDGHWHSADAGIDFSIVHDPITSFASFGRYIYAGQGINTNEYRSSDNGGSWSYSWASPIATNGKILFSGGESYPGADSIYISLDSGTSWHGVESPNVIAFGTIGPVVIACLATTAMKRSTDNGASWTSVSYPLALPVSFAVIDTIIFAASSSGTQGLAYSSDSGATWKTINFPHSVTALATDGKHLWAGTMDSGVYISLDTGQHWRNVSDGLQYFLQVTAMSVYDTMMVVATISPGTQNYWQAWRPISEMLDTTQSAVAELPGRDSLSIFPNPATGMVSIFSGGTLIYAISVLNVLGTEVQTVPHIARTSVALDLSKLPAGTYFARIETANGIVVRKILKE